MSFQIFICICIYINIFKIEPEVKAECFFSTALHLVFPSQGPTLNLELDDWLNWLANNPQGTSCLCLFSTGIPAVCHCAQRLHVHWGLKIRSSCLCGKHFTRELFVRCLDFLLVRRKGWQFLFPVTGSSNTSRKGGFPSHTHFFSSPFSGFCKSCCMYNYICRKLMGH